MFNPKQPDGLRALIGHRVAVEQIAHGFVEVALTRPGCCEKGGSGSLALGGDGGGEVLLGEKGWEAEVGGRVAERVGKPPREPGRQVADARAASGRIVLYRRVIVRKGTFRTCAWPRHRRGLDNDRRLIGTVLEVVGNVGGIDVLGLPAAGGVSEYRAAAAGLLVFWRLGNGWAGGRGAGCGTAGGVDHGLGPVAVRLGEKFG